MNNCYECGKDILPAWKLCQRCEDQVNREKTKLYNASRKKLTLATEEQGGFCHVCDEECMGKVCIYCKGKMYEIMDAYDKKYITKKMIMEYIINL